MKTLNPPEFKGICMAHGAQDTVTGHEQYLAYCAHTRTDPKVREGHKLFKGTDFGVRKSL